MLLFLFYSDLQYAIVLFYLFNKIVYVYMQKRVFTQILSAT